MNILITGADSYIGTSFQNWVKSHGINADVADTRDNKWQKIDFSKYDTVFHVAGIAHTQAKADKEALYYRVNCDLAEAVAMYARESGVRQFIFMSSIIVYGSRNDVIAADTLPNPDNFYGRSKLLAEKRLFALENDDFHVAVIRSPMVYGKGSKGNYPRLSRLSQKTPFFPDVKNRRSMIYINNLCEFIYLIAFNDERGVFFPQNREYVNTADLVREIRKCHGKKTITVNTFNPAIRFFARRSVTASKVFGSLYYDKKMSEYNGFEYCVTDFETSVKETEL